jgi:hypothetical protein
LLADAAGYAGHSAVDITSSLLRSVRAFAGKALQSDDIAILTLKVTGDGCLKLELRATPEEVMRGVEAQLNVENLLGVDYFPAAHSDNNIAPGAPRNAKLTLRFGL